MLFSDVLAVALGQIRANKLRSFFTLLGIIVSVAFLVAVVAIIQGMNAYVKESVAGAVIGTNSFQIRRTPIKFGIIVEDEWREIQKRPRITAADAGVVAAAIPDAQAVALSSGWPTPQADVIWRSRTVGDVVVFGVTAAYQEVQDYRFAHGRPLTDVDIRERRFVVVLGPDVAERLFEELDPVGRYVRLHGARFQVVGVTAKKGRVLGQSFDGFVLLPITAFETIYGRRLTTTVSVKMPDAADIASAMVRAEEAMRIAHALRPGESNDFSIEAADALVDFWKTLTRVLFSVVPAVVAIGIVVGGIVIMNIMLMAVNERTREIGIRKAVGARASDIRRQFLAESVILAVLGGGFGVALGAAFAMLVATASPLPARVTLWSVALALTLGASVGVLFGVYPAARAARLDPVAAMRAE
ncbi:MAG: ABC transporter permease [Gemmatimonadota bacterium]|nr:ABC transporter permease [Gemmatimonadota bacterium]